TVVYLFVCSTYGDGELPASAKPFGAAMDVRKPDLSAVRFAVFGLGDSEYEETFNHGSKRIMDLMEAAGAKRIGDRVTHDASGSDMAEDIALPWADDIVELAGRMNRENA
ncbi:MAG: flavodoxin domain-containing protein, partial [Rhizobiaceae bacterium]